MNPTLSFRFRKNLLFSLSFLGSLIPLLPLFTHANFNNDWVNHLWSIAYYGEFFKQHFSFPTLIHTSQLVGLTQPLFYGTLFYPPLGILASLLGARAALGVSCLALWGIQFFLVVKVVTCLSRKDEKNDLLSLLVALLVCWATYPLTNLYHRAALPEFFATVLFFCGVCSWVLCVFQESEHTRVHYLFLTVLLLVLAAGMHPITAYFGGGTFVLLLPFTLFILHSHKEKPNKIFYALGFGAAVLGMFVLLPWLYACLKFQKTLTSMSGPSFYVPMSDTLLNRFFPVPLDARVFTEGMTASTPFLDTQVNVALLLLSLGTVLFSHSKSTKPERKPLLFFSLSFFFFLGITLVSCEYPGSELLPFLSFLKIERVQYFYRLVTYSNLWVFLMALAAIRLRQSTPVSDRPAFLGLKAFCLALGLVGLIVKLNHVHLAVRPKGDRQVERSIDSNYRHRLPPTFYSHNDYQMNREWVDPGPAPQKSSFPVSPGASFGKLNDPIEFELTEKQWIVTNVAAFDWVELLLDGTPIPPSELFLAPHFIQIDQRTIAGNPYLDRIVQQTALLVPPGKHQLSIRFNPDREWLILYRLAFASFALLFTALTFSWFIPTFRGLRVFQTPLSQV